jgi:phage terminase small subunit
MNVKQEQFCREYLIDLNAAQAAIRAGYSKRSARTIGHRLLTNDDVQATISKLKADRSREVGVDAQWVLKRLVRIADFDIRKLFDNEGNLLPIKQLDEDTALALASIDIGEITNGDGFISQTKKVKAIDKRAALELIGRHVGMFVDKVETKITEGQVTIYLPDNGRDASQGAN